MTFDEFMKLPLESRKRIELAILYLDKAVQDEFGFSMMDTERRVMKKVNELPTPTSLDEEKSDG